MTREVLCLVSLWLGLIFIFIASLGVLRMPDILCRSQASSIATTLGKIGIFTAAALAIPGGEVLSRAILILFFIFLTAPIGAHMITRATYLRGAVLDPRTINEDKSGKLN